MSNSFTATATNTFTVTHAKQMASKVAADLKRLQRFYGEPDDQKIANYETEVVALLKEGYLGTLTMGFKRNGQWIEPALRYTAQDLNGAAAANDDPGKINPSADVTGATFYNYLTYSDKWWNLTSEARDEFKSNLPVQRTTADEPGVNGYVVTDITYSAGGRALNRSSIKSL